MSVRVLDAVLAVLLARGGSAGLGEIAEGLERLAEAGLLEWSMEDLNIAVNLLLATRLARLRGGRVLLAVEPQGGYREYLEELASHLR